MLAHTIRIALCLLSVLVCLTMVQTIAAAAVAAEDAATASLQPQTVAERNVQLAQKWMAMDGDAIMEVVWEQEKHGSRGVVRHTTAEDASRMGHVTPPSHPLSPDEETIATDGIVVALTSHHPAHREVFQEEKEKEEATAAMQDRRAREQERLCRQYAADLLADDLDVLSAATDYAALAHCLRSVLANTPEGLIAAAAAAESTTGAGGDGQGARQGVPALLNTGCVFNMNHSCLSVPASLGNYPASNDETRGTLAIALAAMILTVTLFIFIF